MDISIFDPLYVQKQQVASLQRLAAEQNTLRLQLFQTACDAYVRSGGKSAVPEIPKKILVSDAGVQTEGEFTGLSVPVIQSTAPTPAGTGFFGGTGAAAVDRTDQIIAILKVLNDKLDALAAKGN